MEVKMSIFRKNPNLYLVLSAGLLGTLWGYLSDSNPPQGLKLVFVMTATWAIYVPLGLVWCRFVDWIAERSKR